MQTEQAVALHILMNEDFYFIKNDWALEETPAEAVLTEIPVADVQKTEKPKFTFIGKNLKNFLVLTDQGLNNNQLAALENTLARKQMGFNDVAIVDFSAYPNTHFEDLRASFMPQKLVCFGLKPEGLNLPETTLNEIHHLPDFKILFTYSFTEMLGNKDKTKAFWEAMKAL